MAQTFKFELVSPERILMSEDVEMVVVPGTEGAFAIMQGHEPTISTLRPGVLDVTGAEGHKRIFVKGGLAQVDADSATILAEHSFVLDDADPSQTTAELDAVEAALKDDNDIEALDHLTRAIADIKAGM